jgi:HlyD family secretion protein
MSTTTQNGELVNRVQQLRLKNQLGADTGRGGGSAASWLPWILCLVMVLAWAGVGIRTYRNPGNAGLADGQAVSSTSSQTTPSAVASTTSTPAAPAAGTIVLEVKGYIVPAQQIAISPIEVAGRLLELNAIEGKFFKKGDVLARIEDVSYQAQVAESVAALESSRQRLASAKQRLAVMLPDSVRKVEVAQMEEEFKEAEAQRGRMADDVARFERLGTSAADRELKQARFDLLANEARVRRLQASLTLLKEGPRQEQKAAAEAEVKGAEADIKAAEARLAQAQWRLNNCIIRSPIDGTVLSKKSELGSIRWPLPLRRGASATSRTSRTSRSIWKLPNVTLASSGSVRSAGFGPMRFRLVRTRVNSTGSCPLRTGRRASFSFA